jgi:DNA-binding transcriptional ArsR family regulator
MATDRLDELERRIAWLESQIDGAAAPPRTARDAKPLTRVLHAWRREAEEKSLPGTLGYLGYFNVEGREDLWTRQHSLAELLPADWSPAAGVLEALASPQRLALLKALVLHGRRTTNELLEALGGDQEGTTSGQLYHHLRALQGARLIMQRRRGEYGLAPGAMVPILTIIAPSLAVATDAPLGPPFAPKSA